MELSQIAQIFSILSGLSVIAKLIFDVKSDILELKSEYKKTSEFVHYKFAEFEKRIERLEDLRHDAR